MAPKHLQFRPRRDEPDLAEWANRVLGDGTHREKLALAIRFYILHGEPESLPLAPGVVDHQPTDLLAALSGALPDLARRLAGELRTHLVGATVAVVETVSVLEKAPAPIPAPVEPAPDPSVAARLKDRFRQSSGMDDDDDDD